MWVSISPGVVVAILNWGCWGDLPAFGITLCTTVEARSPSVGIYWGLIAALYVGLRGLDFKKTWDKTNRITWVTEVALLVVGGYLVWFVVISLFILTYQGTF